MGYRLMGYRFKKGVSPLRGLYFLGMGARTRGLRPGLGCFAPSGRPPRTQPAAHG